MALTVAGIVFQTTTIRYAPLKVSWSVSRFFMALLAVQFVSRMSFSCATNRGISAVETHTVARTAAGIALLQTLLSVTKKATLNVYQTIMDKTAQNSVPQQESIIVGQKERKYVMKVSLSTNKCMRSTLISCFRID